MAEQYSIVCIYYILFIQSSVDGYLGCFHTLKIVNNDAKKIGVHGSFQISGFVFSDKWPRNELAGINGSITCAGFLWYPLSCLKAQPELKLNFPDCLLKPEPGVESIQRLTDQLLTVQPLIAGLQQLLLPRGTEAFPQWFDLIVQKWSLLPFQSSNG